MQVNKFWLVQFGMSENDAKKVMGYLKSKINFESKQVRNENGILRFQIRFKVKDAVEALKTVKPHPRLLNLDVYQHALRLLSPLAV